MIKRYIRRLVLEILSEERPHPISQESFYQLLVPGIRQIVREELKGVSQ